MTEAGGLLDAEFLRELQALRGRLRTEVRSGGPGERVSRRRGGNAEFLEHRPYVAGDDLRRIDWAAFARSGTPVVKAFRAEEDAVLRLVLDASASLDFGNPTKIDTSRRLCAAFAYLALTGAGRVQLLVCGAGAVRALAVASAPRRGQGSLHRVLAELSAVHAAGPASLSSALSEVLVRSPRPGRVVVVSDFFDPGPFTEALERLRARGHEVSLVQVLSSMDLEPEFEGDIGLVDAETDAELDVTMDAGAVEAYLSRLAGLVEELRGTARRLQGSYVRTRTGEPLVDAVGRWVRGAID